MSEEKRPEWMTSISATVDPEDYLLGRKIDKTFELSQKEKADKAREARNNLIASDKLRLTGDPILDLERRKETLKFEIMTNPVKRKQMRDYLLKLEGNKQTTSRDKSYEGESCSSNRNLSYGNRNSESSRREEKSSSSHQHHRGHRSPARDYERSSRGERHKSDHRQDRSSGHRHRHRYEDESKGESLRNIGDRYKDSSQPGDKTHRDRHRDERQPRKQSASPHRSHSNRDRAHSPRRHRHERR